MTPGQSSPFQGTGKWDFITQLLSERRWDMQQPVIREEGVTNSDHSVWEDINKGMCLST